MKIGKCEFGIIKEPDNVLTELAWKSGDLKRYEEHIWKSRTLKWFLKKIFSFNRIHYNCYKSPCNCLMLDFGPFYFTVLSKECDR